MLTHQNSEVHVTSAEVFMEPQPQVQRVTAFTVTASVVVASLMGLALAVSLAMLELRRLKIRIQHDERLVPVRQHTAHKH